MDNNSYTDILQICCRTCMKEILDASFFYLDCTPSTNTQLTIRQTLYSCIPELDLSIVPNPVMCSKCVHKLLSVFEFKKDCLESEMQINKYIEQVQHTGDLNLVEVSRFHQPHIKNVNLQVKIEDRDIKENFKNEDFKEESECIESFYQPDIQNLLHTEIKIEDFEITEDFKNEDIVCDTNAFNEASECTGSTEPKYLLELQKVDMEDVLFNTFDDYNINYNLSAAEENSDAHNSNIAQNCLQEVVEHQGHDYSKNVNKTNAYYQCYRCGHKAESKLKLILHLKRHKRSKFKKSKQHFSHQNSLKPNMRAHVVEKVFNCSVCEYQCNFKVNLNRHMRIHTRGKPFSCSVCKYQSSQKGHLNRHMLIHTGEKPFSCSVCEYQFGHKSNLKQHMLIHTGEKPFSCSVCEYQCNQKSSLKAHMLIHTGEKPFSCSICEYQCRYKSRLKQHMLIHTGEKQFSCFDCEYQSSHKSALKKHVLIHREEKPFSCSICEYQCRWKNNLTTHTRIHTGVKPFSCSVCEYQCNQKNNLKRHMQIHA